MGSSAEMLCAGLMLLLVALGLGEHMSALPTPQRWPRLSTT